VSANLAAVAAALVVAVSCNAQVYFRRVAEPREKAFTILVPAGWRTEGGIVRVNPMAANGPANAIAAKVDFAVKRDAAGSVMLRALPEMMYADLRRTPVGGTGMFPVGSQYNGMTVYPVTDAATFLAQVAFKYAHPRATAARVADRRRNSRLAQAYAQRLRASGVPFQFRYDAAVITVNYQEGGAAYTEKLFTVIEDMGQAGGGIWSNKDTVLVRAPAGEFEKWAPILSIVQSSVQMNPQWVAGEIRGQMQRNKIALDVQRDIQRIDREIVAHRQRTDAEINNDMFLTLTGQEEYINPHTNQVEMGSNQWKNRWVTPSGDVVYSDDSSYDPNHDPNLNRTDFKRTPVRPR